MKAKQELIRVDYWGNVCKFEDPYYVSFVDEHKKTVYVSFNESQYKAFLYNCVEDVKKLPKRLFTTSYRTYFTCKRGRLVIE